MGSPPRIKKKIEKYEFFISIFPQFLVDLGWILFKKNTSNLFLVDIGN
jgi:hypothetical protein